jgi:predicted transcriptional regulator
VADLPRNVTFEVPPDVVEALQKIAKEQGISVGAAVTTSVNTTLFVLDQIKAGKKVLIEDKDKRLSEVRLLPVK